MFCSSSLGLVLLTPSQSQRQNQIQRERLTLRQMQNPSGKEGGSFLEKMEVPATILEEM